MGHEKYAKPTRQIPAGVGVAAAALLVAATFPLVIAPEACASDVVQVSDVALVSSPLDVGDIASALSSADLAGGAFNLSGLITAELDAAKEILHSLLAVPGTLFHEVVDGIQTAIHDAVGLNFGMAFSALAEIPLQVFNTIVGVPFTVGEGIYNMLLTIPGEFLFNFGDITPSA